MIGGRAQRVDSARVQSGAGVDAPAPVTELLPGAVAVHEAGALLRRDALEAVADLVAGAGGVGGALLAPAADLVVVRVAVVI